MHAFDKILDENTDFIKEMKRRLFKELRLPSRKIHFTSGGQSHLNTIIYKWKFGFSYTTHEVFVDLKEVKTLKDLAFILAHELRHLYQHRYGVAPVAYKRRVAASTDDKFYTALPDEMDANEFALDFVERNVKDTKVINPEGEPTYALIKAKLIQYGLCL